MTIHLPIHSNLRLAADEPPPSELSEYQVLDIDDRRVVFITNGSRIYEVDRPTASVLRGASAGEPRSQRDLLAGLGLDRPAYIEPTPPESVPMRSISLAVAQRCNLGCTYCYAQGGDFGGPPKSMPLAVALASVERLFLGVEPGQRVNLAFLGGEPLTNRLVVRAATERARALAAEHRAALGLSITTNGTLVSEDDGEFFERHGFAVTISLDGVGDVHDRLRPYKNGRGSYEEILRRVTPLLERQSNMQVSARVTVTPRNLGLVEALHGLIAAGFHSVGFSPMLSSPTGADELSAGDMSAMLEQMILCAGEFERRTCAGQHFPFSNVSTALREIHRGTHRPYPCGAGGGYFGVSADGGLFTCHRFVDDDRAAMGSIDSGVDATRQRRWLGERHVDFQKPCSDCWARYLCGGGCHHEVIRRGRPACDYIRGWLRHCLQVYVRVLAARPEFFGPAPATTV